MPLRGVYVPIPTFFTPEEDLDFETLERHINYLSHSGIAGIILLGSTGEAVHLSEEERRQVVSAGAHLIQTINPALQVIAGTGAESVRLTLERTRHAAEAGAQYALILPPSYYRGSVDSRTILDYYTQVADDSPLPVVIYNYPGVTQGVDVDAATLALLAAHPNIVGIKGTDGNIGKVGYLAEHAKGQDFSLLAGSADFFLPALSVGAVGLVPGLGNVLPRSCVQIQTLFDAGRLQEASACQRKLVKPDNALARWNGLPGVKAGMQQLLGYGGQCRRPLRQPSKEAVEAIVNAVQPALIAEQQLGRPSS